MEILETGRVLLFVFCTYLLPTLIAALRRHPSGLGIAALNLFAGWTVIGWFFSFIWSLTSTGRQRTSIRRA